MPNKVRFATLMACLLTLAPSWAVSQPQAPPLSVTPPSLRGVVGNPFRVQLTASGGSSPYRFRLLEKQFPEGLRLDPGSGLISGSPKVAGEFKIPVALTDSSAPPHEIRFELTINILSAVGVKWKAVPSVSADGISGSVVVENHTARTLQFTVIILAVSEVNKAFALGYQHFDLRPDSESPVISFGSALPFGSYVTHVDAVAEDLVRKNIYRSRLQTGSRLKLQQH